MLYLGIILEEHTLRHKVYGTVINNVHKVLIMGTETRIVVYLSYFLVLIIMKKRTFIDSPRLWRRERGAKSVAAATSNAEICRGPDAVLRFLRW